MDGVLAVRHEQALLEDDAAAARSARPAGPAPGGTRRRCQHLARACRSRSALLSPPVVAARCRPAGRAAREVVQHHRAAERRRQGGDQQAVVAPRRHAGDRARGVAAEAVGDQPLAGRAAGVRAGIGRGRATAIRRIRSVIATATPKTSGGVARQDAPAVGADRAAGVPRAAVRGCPRSTRERLQRVPAGGASSGSASGGSGEVAAQVDHQQPVVAGPRRRSAGRTPRARARRRPRRRRPARGTPGPRAAGGAGRGAARRPRRAARARRGRACSARTSRRSAGSGSARLGLGSGQARELRQELGAPARASFGQLGLVVGEVEERGSRRRTPGPGRASASPGPAGAARSSPGSGRGWSAGGSASPRRELATWSWFWRKLTNDGRRRGPSAGVPRRFFCQA